MAFTGRLGTSDSYLGNISLGASGASSSGSEYDNSLSLIATNNISFGLNDSYNLTISLSSISDNSYLDILSLLNNISIEAISNIESSFSIFEVLTITAISDLSIISSFTYDLILSISGEGNLSSLSGFSYFNSVPIEGFSNLTLLSGFTYSESFNIEGVSDIQQDYEYFLGQSLTIDGISGTSQEYNLNGVANLVIEGFSSFTFDAPGEFDRFISLSGSGQVFIENIYDILLISAAISTIGIAEEKLSNSNQNPAASGSLAFNSQATFNRAINQTLNLLQNIVRKKPTNILSAGLTFSQTINVKKVKNVSVTHSLSITQDPEASREVENTIVFDQDIDNYLTKPRNITQSLNITQVISLNTVLNRSITNTLAFNIEREIRLPIIGGTQYSYYASLIDYVLVPRKCLVILSVPERTIVLPCPLFGDSQAYQGSLTLHRSMTGGTRTYVKQTRLQKLEYNFEIWTDKYLELADFIYNYNSRQIRLNNWKGEVWVVNIMNNPVEFAAEGRYQPKGEKYTLTLQFQGVKLRG